MRLFDWVIFVGFLAYVIWDGTRHARDQHSSDDYLLAGRRVPWWAMWLSIMATQASAITMIGTTGQGWHDGLRFVQFYFALPLAMWIIAYTAVPLYHRHRVRTAYEYLGVRFDTKTRVLSAFLFLILRGLSVGFVIYTPSLVLAKVIGFPLGAMILTMGGVAITYTAFGGLGAVISTDVKQMTVMALGLVVAFVALVTALPDDVGFGGAMTLARSVGHLEAWDLGWDPGEKYTLWSSLLGGLFLFLSYFGTDQSQVQRLLAGRSLGDVRRALLANGIAKVPFQFIVLLMGVLLFVFYTFEPQPISFEPAVDQQVEALEPAARARYDNTTRAYVEALAAEERAARALVSSDAGPVAAEESAYRAAVDRVSQLREEAREIRGGTSDTNYVFLDFILNHLPVGVVGLLLAAIFAAALSSIDSELNAMATVAVVDIYELGRKESDGPSLVGVSRLATVLVGAFATTFALYAGEIGSLIEAVNRVGSYVYGSLLGAFVLAVGVRRANGHGAFTGLVLGMVAVAIAAQTDLAFLYLNTVGTVVVVATGWTVSLLTTPQGTKPPPER